MHARKLALVALLIGSGHAHAQFGMQQPMVNPLALLAPLGMMAAPALMPLGANLMAPQMYNPQAMMNPYMNPMASGNPFMMMQPAPAYGYGRPAAPAFGGWGMPAAPAPQPAPLSFFPMMPTAPAAQPAAPAYGGWGMPVAPAPQPQAAPMPFFPMMPAAVPAPQSAAPVANPFDLTKLMQMLGGMAPAPAAAPASTPAAKSAAPAAPASNPIDLSVLMQMMGGMQPIPAAAPVAPAKAVKPAAGK
ncbi:MAG: hypothetical protein R6W97_09555 [Thiobacillus sp.]